MKYLFIAWFLILSSCANSGRVHDTIDPEFTPYLRSFWADSVKFGNSQFGREIPINFIGSEAIGGRSARCKTYHYLDYGIMATDLEIFVSRNHWELIDDNGRKALIYHELTHCFLGRGHENSEVEFKGESIKGSLMNRSIDFTLTGGERDYFYLHELFNNELSIWDEK